MIVFHADLDNTLIFSYKHEIGTEKRLVERYQGREVSYMTEETFRLLKEIKKKVLVVPTTTRTIQQYERIQLGIGALPYALVCNGGILLEEGKEVASWYQTSLELAARSKAALVQGSALLEREPERSLEVRNIRELFVFTKCRNAETVVRHLKEELDLSLVDVFCQGEKTYIIPKSLRKGMAVRRFREYIHGDQVIAAGDSPFDISMFQEADIGIAPFGLARKHKLPGQTVCMPERNVYSQELLEYIGTMIKNRTEFGEMLK